MDRAAADRAASAAKTTTVAICGNPNSGKTTIFNAITGLRQRVANYPGVTVEKVTGRFSVGPSPAREFVLIDVPGAYSLSAFSPDEYIAASTLFGTVESQPPPDVIITVLDATNLERGLYLLLQVLEIGRPVVAAVNMTDLARRRGITIDTGRLSRALGGIPAVSVIGNRGVGIEQLKDAVVRAAEGPLPVLSDQRYDEITEQTLRQMVDRFGNGYGNRAEYLRVIFDSNGPAEKSYVELNGPEAARLLHRGRDLIKNANHSLSAAETTPLIARAADIAGAAVAVDTSTAKTRSERADRLLLHSVVGPVILLLVMVLVFQSIFSWAEPFMNLIDSGFSALAALVAAALPAGPVQSLLVDGVIGGVGSVLVFIPQIVILFIFIALLEDSGYMARAAFLVDRLFRWCGLSGKSFIPMLSSFACAVPGIMATRTIEDRKLRIITIMVSPLMTCSARLPVYAILIAAFVPYRVYLGVFNLQGTVLTLLYLLGIFVAAAVSFVLSSTIFRTERTTFLMEMPCYKLPTFRSVTIRVLNRVRSFVVRAGTVIMAITIVIWALSYYPRSAAVHEHYDSLRATTQKHYESALMAVAQNLRSSAFDQGDLAAVTSSFATATTEAELSTVRDSLHALPVFPSALIDAAFQKRRLELERRQLLQQIANDRAGAQIRESYFGRVGHAVEPLFRPLGWDWKITMATLASFPAREVIIATLGTIFNLGRDTDEESRSLVERMRQATWQSGPRQGRPLFTLPVALSVMVFFALCCQCGATVVTIRHETGSWIYSVVTFAYMTGLAYLLALVTYQIAAGVGV